MKYPERLSEDLKYLANWYQWDADDKKEIRAMFTGCEKTVNFLMALAAAHRAGYNDPAGKSFQTLESWCRERGLQCPFDRDFDTYDLVELDKLAV